MRKTVYLFLVLLTLTLMFSFAMTSCGGGNDSNLYELYNNVVRIDKFENGMAAFVIHEPSSESHFDSQGTWTGDYYYGFINTKGNVIVEPICKCSPNAVLPKFEYNCIRVVGDGHERIVDKKGKIRFETWEYEGNHDWIDSGDITRIGEVSEGYFWVEYYYQNKVTNEETYTIRYYSADDFSVVATFENASPVYASAFDSHGDSTLNSSGDATIAYKIKEDGHYSWEYFTFNIGEYDKSNSPKEEEVVLNIDLEQIDDFYDGKIIAFNAKEPIDISLNMVHSTDAICCYNVSGKNDTKRQLAIVYLMDMKDYEQYYSIVDSDGNVLMKPQKNIIFPLEEITDLCSYVFCKDLCPAKDEESGLWGYIDPNGNWKIEPQFASAQAFSDNGLAVVDDKIVINTQGNKVIAPIE